MIRNDDGVLSCKAKGVNNPFADKDSELIDVEVRCKTSPQGFTTFSMSTVDFSTYIHVFVSNDMKKMFEIINGGEET